MTWEKLKRLYGAAREKNVPISVPPSGMTAEQAYTLLLGELIYFSLSLGYLPEYWKIKGVIRCNLWDGDKIKLVGSSTLEGPVEGLIGAL